MSLNSRVIKRSKESACTLGQEGRENRHCAQIDNSRKSTPLDQKVVEILAKWKKNPETVNRLSTLKEASEKLADFSTEELINMYNDNHPNRQFDSDYLEKECDLCDPENVIAYRRWHEEQTRNKKAA